MSEASGATGGVARTNGTRPGEDCAIEIRGVHKRFGGVVALGGVDLDVPKGHITALIGPNGAGKSSLFNVITGHMAPDEGTVRIMGEDVVGRPMWDLARMGVARTFQTPRGFHTMTVLENLLVSSQERPEGMFAAFLPRRSRKVREHAFEVLERIGLADLAERRYDELSAGQMHVLEIGRQLMRDVQVLLLDEPTAGVIPAAQERVAALLKDLGASGLTILVVEHNLKFVFTLAGNVAVMSNGRVMCCGTPAEVQRDEAVIDAYLGRSAVQDA